MRSSLANESCGVTMPQVHTSDGICSRSRIPPVQLVACLGRTVIVYDVARHENADQHLE